MGLDRDLFPKGEGRRRFLSLVAERLTLLRAVDAAEADTFRVWAVQNFEGIAVEDGDTGGGGSHTLKR